MRERIESELGSKGWGYSTYGYLVGLAGLALAGLSVYYARTQHNRETLEVESVRSDGVAVGSPDRSPVKITKEPKVKPAVKLDTLYRLNQTYAKVCPP